MFDECFFNLRRIVRESGVVEHLEYHGYSPAAATEQLSDGGQVSILPVGRYVEVYYSNDCVTLDNYGNGGNSFMRKGA